MIEVINRFLKAMCEGRVLQQPDWSVGPLQTADGISYAILNRRGDPLEVSSDPVKIAHTAYLLTMQDFNCQDHPVREIMRQRRQRNLKGK
mgnify:CR=1